MKKLTTLFDDRFGDRFSDSTSNVLGDPFSLGSSKSQGPIFQTKNQDPFVKVHGTKGDDTSSGTAGDDRFNAGHGDDTFVYNRTENEGSQDVFDGKQGNDTLSLDLTRGEFETFQQDFVDLQSWLDSGGKGNFDLFNGELTVRHIENMDVRVDGEVVDDVGKPLPPEGDPLFTENNDTVDFNDAATAELASSQLDTNDHLHNALSGDDLVILADTESAADVASYDTSIAFNAGAGNDVVTGGSLDDMINGNAGNDVLWGNGGDDVLNGGSGADFIEGGEGDDIINGGDGRDYIYGDSYYRYGEGGNGLSYGNDTLDGGKGDDFVIGGQGDDTLIFHYGENYTIDYYNGNQKSTIYYNNTREDSHDTLELHFETTDELATAAFQILENMYIIDDVGGGWFQVYHTELRLVTAGIDEIEVYVNGVEFSREDMISVLGDAGITAPTPGLGRHDYSLKLNATIEESGRDQSAFIKQPGEPGLTQEDMVQAQQEATGPILTGEGEDEYDLIIPGTSGDDVIVGGSGSDFIDGYAGNDIIDGGAGADVIRGGAGDDRFIFGVDIAYEDVLDGGYGDDTLEFNFATQEDLLANIGTVADAIEYVETQDTENTVHESTAGFTMVSVENVEVFVGGIELSSLEIQTVVDSIA